MMMDDNDGEKKKTRIMMDGNMMTFYFTSFIHGFTVQLTLSHTHMYI